MKIPCCRCGKIYDSPDAKSAAYVIRGDLEGKTGVVCFDCVRPDDFVVWGRGGQGKRPGVIARLKGRTKLWLAKNLLR
jgi:hypothetical protein